MSYTPTRLGTQLINGLMSNYQNTLLELLKEFDNKRVLIENKQIRSIQQLKILNTGFLDGQRFYCPKPEYFTWGE